MAEAVTTAMEDTSDATPSPAAVTRRRPAAAAAALTPAEKEALLRARKKARLQDPQRLNYILGTTPTAVTGSAAAVAVAVAEQPLHGHDHTASGGGGAVLVDEHDGEPAVPLPSSPPAAASLPFFPPASAPSMPSPSSPSLFSSMQTLWMLAGPLWRAWQQRSSNHAPLPAASPLSFQRLLTAAWHVSPWIVVPLAVGGMSPSFSVPVNLVLAFLVVVLTLRWGAIPLQQALGQDVGVWAQLQLFTFVFVLAFAFRISTPEMTV